MPFEVLSLKNIWHMCDWLKCFLSKVIARQNTTFNGIPWRRELQPRPSSVFICLPRWGVTVSLKQWIIRFVFFLNHWFNFEKIRMHLSTMACLIRSSMILKGCCGKDLLHSMCAFLCSKISTLAMTLHQFIYRLFVYGLCLFHIAAAFSLSFADYKRVYFNISLGFMYACQWLQHRNVNMTNYNAKLIKSWHNYSTNSSHRHYFIIIRDASFCLSNISLRHLGFSSISLK